MSENCGNCRFYGDLFCKRHAPVLGMKPPSSGMMGEVHSYTTWPYTNQELWCGEYEPRKPKDNE